MAKNVTLISCFFIWLCAVRDGQDRLLLGRPQIVFSEEVRSISNFRAPKPILWWPIPWFEFRQKTNILILFCQKCFKNLLANISVLTKRNYMLHAIIYILCVAVCECFPQKTANLTTLQSTLVISTSVISNDHLSRRENLIPVLT